MQPGSHAQAPSPNQMTVLAGTLAHLSSYLQTGCPRALQLARLLLDRLDGEAAFAMCSRSAAAWRKRSPRSTSRTAPHDPGLRECASRLIGDWQHYAVLSDDEPALPPRRPC